MMADLKEKFSSLINKIKGNKKLPIFIALIIGLIVVSVYLISLDTAKTKNQEENDNLRTEFSTSAEYTDYLENKLESVITSLKGVGSTEVVVTLSKGFEYIYQTEEETKTTSNGTSISSSNLALVDGKPVVLEEIYPVIKGIIVLAEGSGDVSVRLDILNLILTMVDVDTSQIKIMEGK